MSTHQAPEFLDEIDNPDDPDRPNRMCVCISDLHFTDGTVGIQSRSDWDDLFRFIRQECDDEKIEELFVILDGDVVDLIRSARWSQHGFYPWERESGKAEDRQRFAKIVGQIMGDIGRKHADGAAHECHEEPQSSLCSGVAEDGGNCAFFRLLQELQGDFKQAGKRIEVLVLLGNHDKELLSAPEALEIFYRDCLGWQTIPAHYRDWVARQYGNPDFNDPDAVPWFPFYFADRGFRLFITHGQWRDGDNSRAIGAEGGRPGWSMEHGWQPQTWRQLDYRPFTEACFGDTVAAGVLSTFIWKGKQALNKIHAEQSLDEAQKDAINRLCLILSELDLYRPSFAAVSRILEETTRIKKAGKGRAPAIAEVIEDILQTCVDQWLGWPFTYRSSPPRRRIGLRIFRAWLWLSKRLHRGLELKSIELLMKLLAWFRGHFNKEGVEFSEMVKFPAFLPEYRKFDFRIHGEGHTHNPLQEEPDLKALSDADRGKNYTYVNFGTWRDRIEEKNTGQTWFERLFGRKQTGYRRQSVGRVLFVLDLKPKHPGHKRQFAYYVEDNLTWSDRLDWK
jgi:hypothetical protein